MRNHSLGDDVELVEELAPQHRDLVDDQDLHRQAPRRSLEPPLDHLLDISGQVGQRTSTSCQFFFEVLPKRACIAHIRIRSPHGRSLP
jgi:hypothetical protein